LPCAARFCGPPSGPGRAGDYKWLAGAVILGGVIGPALLMLALAASSASSVSLLLNLESVFTALLACSCFERISTDA